MFATSRTSARMFALASKSSTYCRAMAAKSESRELGSDPLDAYSKRQKYPAATPRRDKLLFVSG